MDRSEDLGTLGSEIAKASLFLIKALSAHSPTPKCRLLWGFRDGSSIAVSHCFWSLFWGPLPIPDIMDQKFWRVGPRKGHFFN